MPYVPTERRRLYEYERVQDTLRGMTLARAAAFFAEKAKDKPGLTLDWGQHSSYGDDYSLVIVDSRDETDGEMAARHEIERRYYEVREKQDIADFKRLSAMFNSDARKS
jgi:hypothetical protein